MGPVAMSRVLFVCVGNTGRSVMAERLFRRAVGARHEARSAGVSPGTRVEPAVVEALAELGVDASDHVPRPLDDDALAWADVVVATCAEACPEVTVARLVRWQIPDAYGLPVDGVRPIRDRIAAEVDALAVELDA
jgi:arsenate reductase (thioredoxin)